MGRQTDNKMSVWTILLCLLILLKGIVAEEAGPTPPPMYISSTLYNQSFHNIILDVYAKSEGVPSECRKDLCEGGEDPGAVFEGRGNFTWPDVVAGNTAHILCPFGGGAGSPSGAPPYGTRECTLSYDPQQGEWTASWARPDLRACQQSYPHRTLRDIFTNSSNNCSLGSLNYLLAEASGCLEGLISSPSEILIPDDFSSMAGFIESFIGRYTYTETRIPTDQGHHIVSVVNLLMETTLEVIKRARQNVQRILASLIEFTENVQLPPSRKYEVRFRAKNLDVSVRGNDGMEIAGLEHFFSPGDATRVVIKYGIIIDRNHDHSLTQAPVQDEEALSESSRGGGELCLSYIVFHSHVFFELPGRGLSSNRTTGYNYSQAGSDNSSAAIEYSMVDSLVYTNVFTVGAKTPLRTKQAFRVTWLAEGLDSSNTVCGYIGSDNITGKEPGGWQSDVCSLNHRDTTRANRTVCVCTQFGLFAAFVVSSVKHVPPAGHPAAFWRFTSIWELYVVGHICRALSLVALIFTILTYMIFRRTRRGSTTWILLQLCVSLVLLLVVLYVAEVTAQTHTGCRVMNGFRLYFVLVSLMWNGVEGFNMYLLLIRVFNSNITHFMLKTSIIAWGVPLFIALLPPMISPDAYNGEYDVCTFRSSLPELTMHWAFLLPMGVIVLSNLVVFSFVIRILSKQRKEKHVRCAVQVKGAIAMLVLLGVPWLFSAFGTLHTQEDSLALMQFIAQVIFIVFLGAQGLFIAIFHCLRLQEVRHHWRSFLTSGSVTGVSTSSSVSADQHSKGKKESVSAISRHSYLPFRNHQKLSATMTSSMTSSSGSLESFGTLARIQDYIVSLKSPSRSKITPVHN